MCVSVKFIFSSPDFLNTLGKLRAETKPCEEGRSLLRCTLSSSLNHRTCVCVWCWGHESTVEYLEVIIGIIICAERDRVIPLWVDRGAAILMLENGLDDQFLRSAPQFFCVVFV